MSWDREKMGGEFVTVAKLLGHDLDRLRAGEMLRTYQTIPTMYKAREVLSRAGTYARQLRGRTFFNAIRARQRLGQGRHDRGEAVVFADREPTPTDNYGMGRHLPVHVQAISVCNHTIRENEVFDVSVRGDVWGLDDFEELYVIVNVGTLILEAGASLVVRGNVFSFLCQRLVRGALRPGHSGSNTEAFDLGILPTPFSVDFKSGPINGADGARGYDGLNGADGRDARCYGSVFGPIVSGESLMSRDGSAGGPGGPGVDGSPGRNGGMCKLAELTIRYADAKGQPFVVFSQPGRGGNGGRGGDGGDGGRGGRGGFGGKSLRGPVFDGVSGNGGDGGDGGTGGQGGHGGIGSNIYVTLPSEQEDQITCVSKPSEPGDGGAGGKAGGGGAASLAMQGNIPEPTRSHAVAGHDGTSGKSGRRGRGRPGPAMFLNERLVV